MSYPKTIIISGEGEIGTIEAYHGKDTLRAIRRRLTKERCNGDRWAFAYQFVTQGLYEDAVYTNIDNHYDTRLLNKSAIAKAEGGVR